MDEEFLFPQNVQTGYRLWLFGPRHLRRLSLAPVLAILLGWPLAGVSVLAAAIGGTLAGTAYAVVVCVPIFPEEETLWDALREIRRHRRSPNWFM